MPSPADIAARLDALAKPPGSLGRLEHLAAHLCKIQNTLAPETRPRRLVLFAADHGVVEAGVSAWPSAVTGLMVKNILAGGAVSSVLCRTTGTELRVIDVGVIGPAAAGANFRDAKIREGTRNLAVEPAMTAAEFHAAVAVGREEAAAAASDGMRIVAAGEMGIGNTTPAACLTSLLAGIPPAAAVGRGAGADEEILLRKQAVVTAAVGRARANPGRVEGIAAVCGFEIAAMAGFFAEAAGRKLACVLDGFIATAGALVAEELFPGTANALIAAHRSAEPGHTAALAKLGLHPVLDGWQMRLGEGTGALLVIPILDCAAAMIRETAALADLAGG